MQFHAGLAHIANAATQFRLGLFLSFYSCIHFPIYLYIFLSFFFSSLSSWRICINIIVIEPVICMDCDISSWFSSWITSWYEYAAIKLICSEDWIIIIMTHWCYECMSDCHVMPCYKVSCNRVEWLERDRLSIFRNEMNQICQYKAISSDDVTDCTWPNTMTTRVAIVIRMKFDESRDRSCSVSDRTWAAILQKSVTVLQSVLWIYW